MQKVVRRRASSTASYPIRRLGKSEEMEREWSSQRAHGCKVSVNWATGRDSTLTCSGRRVELEIFKHGVDDVDLELMHSTIGNLLRQLGNLEELIVGWLPFREGVNDFGGTPSPYDATLPTLKSVTFGWWFSENIDIPGPLIAGAAQLRYLKLPAVPRISGDSLIWEYGQGGSKEVKLNDMRSIETLSIQIPVRKKLLSTIRCMSKKFPELKTLDITRHEPRVTCVPSIMIAARPPVSPTGEWVFRRVRKSAIDADGYIGEGTPVSFWDTDRESWSNLLDALSKFRCLKEIDVMIEPVLPYNDTDLPAPREDQKRSHYEDRAQRSGRNRMAGNTSQSQLCWAITAAAKMILENIPTLKKGYFWQWSHVENSHRNNDSETCKRWCWAVNEIGEIEAHPWSERISLRWMSQGF
ncbi:uncharacterized protein I303_107124 [Kwoniella dejecticola CBS 10117]|uniref:Uncharacterized protein n=1 Tax=Kwoniella dejecticola CBS 10117 TaxID=1296121 RepID=A0A1A5ZYT7_9TREE|nr:uncharacterized protein I303_06526 [Kwoniella dejecticola CBS 10117]OBR82968.1 hypothetical protein I303_06526 [Kwoniella dejecticola CBS 10117]